MYVFGRRALKEQGFKFLDNTGVLGYNTLNAKAKERVKRKVCKMAEKKNILTYAGLKQYEDELQNLKVVKRKEVAQKIKEAREQGDLSENAEYDVGQRMSREISNFVLRNWKNC